MALPNRDQSVLDFTSIEQHEFVYGDLDNIKATLPMLQLKQQEDVLRIEDRYRVGKGYCITNGTGTGKTFVGLGVVNRFLLMKKERILIVVPSDKKCEDWKDEALTHFGIDIYQLEGVKDYKDGVIVTTYANFYQNTKLPARVFDLVIYDESHYLMQNGQGKQTVYLKQHKEVVNVHSTCRSKAYSYAGKMPDRQSDTYAQELETWKLKYEEVRKKLWKKTKVLFLSATPFAYHKSLIYGDGTLWEMNETEEPRQQSGGYNSFDGYEAFMIEHFGYRMKYNKLTIPESGVDMDLLEREFFEKMYKKGVMSTRQLEVDKDYSRDFIIVEAEEARMLNKGLKTVMDHTFKKSFPNLGDKINTHFNYMYINKLLETIKAKYIHKRIKDHLYLDRQVVIFHSYNHAKVEHPFRFDVKKLIKADEFYLEAPLEREIKLFRETFPHFWNLDLSDLPNTRDSIKEHFPDVLEFNGTVPKKKRGNNIKEFQSDLSQHDIIMVQSQAGREGISLHDQTGHKERVSIDLSLPVAPTEAIQKEGRIYRHGVQSNAAYEYIIVGYTFEEYAFATKIASRAKTVENLALGNLARDLETAFKEGYQNATMDVPHILQGYKGKKKDRQTQDISEFQRSKTYYYARQKNKGMYKHMDYFATPEPLGYKMVEWLNMERGKKFLEPSAGHGAIARFVDRFTDNTFVEPILELSSKLAINAVGEIRQHPFEDLYIGNKFSYIAMNPPYGASSKIAYEHLAKAMKHGDFYGCTIIAIVPQGPASEKRLEELMADKENNKWILASKTLLPDCVFKKESTSVLTQILKFQTAQHYGPNPMTLKETDLRYITDIETFFNVIDKMSI